MKRIIFLSVVFTLGFMSQLRAADFYIVFDPNCMDRLVYTDNFGAPIVKYSYELNDTERLFLRLGQEDQGRLQSYMPSNNFRCGNQFIRENLTKIIQDPSNNVFLVKPERNNAYRILSIMSADYYLQDGQFLSYVGQQYRFSYRPDIANSGQDLSGNDPRGMVMFESNISYGCAQALVFEQRPGISPASYIDIIFVPQLGVVEQSSQQTNNNLKLDRVNNETLSSYLQRFCNETSTGGGYATTYNNFTDRGNPNIYDNPLTTGNNLANVDNRNRNFHIVQKGETLYGLSKQYGVRIDQLRMWNGMKPNDTLLKKGTKLRISDPSNTNNMVSRGVNSYDYSTTNPTFDYSQRNTSPTRFNTGSNNMQKPWENTNTIYIVQAGDNLSSVARKFGYTVERFAAFNDISPNTSLSTGMRLKTTDCNTSNGSMGNNNTMPNNYDYNNQVGNDSSSGMQNPTFNSRGGSTIETPKKPSNSRSYYYYNQSPSDINSNRSDMNTTSKSAGLFTESNSSNSGSSSSSLELFQPYNLRTEDVMSKRGGSQADSPNTYENGSLIDNPALNPPNNPVRPPVTNGFGTPIPNTSAPKITPRTQANNFDSPVPSISTGSSTTGGNSFSDTPTTNSSASTSGQGSASELFKNKRKRTFHVVKQGQTIESIARMYNIPLEELLRLNNMKKGQKVMVSHKVYLN